MANREKRLKKGSFFTIYKRISKRTILVLIFSTKEKEIGVIGENTITITETIEIAMGRESILLISEADFESGIGSKQSTPFLHISHTDRLQISPHHRIHWGNFIAWKRGLKLNI